jgi:hypothetical protein
VHTYKKKNFDNECLPLLGGIFLANNLQGIKKGVILQSQKRKEFFKKI